MTVNDLPVGRSVDETLRLVQAFQFTDEHGEGENLTGNSLIYFYLSKNFSLLYFLIFAVCPAGWKPGSKTMKPDPVGAKDYFKAAN